MSAKVLVLCERSGTIRNAFGAAGFDVTSVDTLESTAENVGNSRHVVGDALDWLNFGAHLVIARPPCTYLANSGARWLYDGRDANGERILNAERWASLDKAIDFFNAMTLANAPRIAIENPIPHKSARHGIGAPTQYVQPYEYGLPESKRTGLWLRNLPPLVETNNVKDEMEKLSTAERNRVHYASPGPDRWMKRSLLADGIAKAMADQWGGLL